MSAQKHRRFLSLVVILGLSHGCGTVAGGPKPPGQPATGPGGAEYSHAKVEAMRTGQGPTEYWVFSPSDPRPEQAPVVIFLHGWGGVHPRVYGAWLQHIVRKGHLVVYPRYQLEDKLRTPGDVMLSGAKDAVREAWVYLTTESAVKPEAQRLVWIGHSMGGVLAVKAAVTAGELGVPPAGALLLIQPGGHDVVPLGDLAALPADAVVEIMTGDEDTLAGESGAKAIAAALADNPARRVEILSMRSERRSRPSLVADHFAPLGVARDFPPEAIVGGDMDMPGGPLREWNRERRQNRYDLDALDYFGFWKIGDALLDATFRGRNLEFGFGDTEEQRFMGNLSDGTPVVPLLVERAN